MQKRLPFLLLILSLLMGYATQAQRRLPHPILFVHGFAGKSDNWLPFTNYLVSQAGVYAAPNNRLDYCLNADGDQNNAQIYASANRRSDIFDYSLILQPSDIYLLNFDACANSGGSNRSAAVKQGYAVGLAVARILAVTGSDQIILMGHSMGGLAIREYLQTSSNWAMNDGRHHVAKVVTVGTPHGGSNLGSGDLNLGLLSGLFGFNDYDELSEAVRDLRTSYKTGYSGVYLFGGYETSTYIRRGLFSSYYNLDVNCNGRTGDLIQGLNQKNMPNDLAYALVIGNSYMGNSDEIVTAFSQNLNNFYNLGAPVFNHPYQHTKAIDQAKFEELYALDEPSQNDHAYSIAMGQTYMGFFTVQANGSWRDFDRYRFRIPSRGVVTANLTIASDATGAGRILSPGGQVLGSRTGTGSFQALLANSGEQYLEIEGTSGNGWRTYFHSLSFCPLPEDPLITNTGKTSFCEGESLTLTTPAVYDSYVWYRDGVRLASTSNQLTVNQGGNYTVEGAKCGVSRPAPVAVGITINPKPSAPTMAVSSDGQGLVSSGSTGNQWLLNGQPIAGATSASLSYSLISVGTVSLQVTSERGCTNTSAPFVITATEPLPTEVLQVYPNPASTQLIVKTSISAPHTLGVTNLLGQLIWYKSVAAAASTAEHTVDVSNWVRGVYLLRVESAMRSKVVKVLVQ